VVTRGERGKLGSLPKSIGDSLNAGLHAVSVDGVRALLYKDKAMLSLFRPFQHSYAVIVAVGDYPADSHFGSSAALLTKRRNSSPNWN